MMKLSVRGSGHWLILFLLTDAAALFAVWILRPEAFRYLALFLFLLTGLSLTAGLYAEYRRRKKDAAVVLRFLEMPDERTGAEVLEHFGDSEAAAAFGASILSMQAQISEKTAGLTEYRDYIEEWVHETKTPLALSALVLENHRDEMPPFIYTRLQYVQHQLNEDVERILYYARLQADHPDMRIVRFRLDECVREVLAEYRLLAEERNISTVEELERAEVDSDRRIVRFMLSQLLGNAVKYADAGDGKISVGIRQTEDRVCLTVCNNGGSVPPEDVPFLFDRGFTGSRPDCQRATGMGLYLVRKYGQRLGVGVNLCTQIPYESGFGIELIFVR